MDPSNNSNSRPPPLNQDFFRRDLKQDNRTSQERRVGSELNFFRRIAQLVIAGAFVILLLAIVAPIWRRFVDQQARAHPSELSAQAFVAQLDFPAQRWTLDSNHQQEASYIAVRGFASSIGDEKILTARGTIQRRHYSFEPATPKVQAEIDRSQTNLTLPPESGLMAQYNEWARSRQTNSLPATNGDSVPVSGPRITLTWDGDEILEFVYGLRIDQGLQRYPVTVVLSKAPEMFRKELIVASVGSGVSRTNYYFQLVDVQH
jgi:hypothetical protein